jgi:thiamine monophosphate kinase
VFENPDKLIFWFDFLEAEGSEFFDKYSVKSIGQRTKSINDSDVKAIYYRDVPNIIFINNIQELEYNR